MSVAPTDWQCCMPTESGLRCTKALIYDRHDGPCVHEHDFAMCGEETMCGCWRVFCKTCGKEIEPYAGDPVNEPPPFCDAH